LSLHCRSRGLHLSFIRASESWTLKCIVVPLLDGLLWWIGSWLHCGFVWLISEDIWVLVRLSCGAWLHRISNKLPLP
jgi:hypothetical protein